LATYRRNDRRIPPSGILNAKEIKLTIRLWKFSCRVVARAYWFVCIYRYTKFSRRFRATLIPSRRESRRLSLHSNFQLFWIFAWPSASPIL